MDRVKVLGLRLGLRVSARVRVSCCSGVSATSFKDSLF